MTSIPLEKNLRLSCEHTTHLVNPYIDEELTPYHAFALEDHMAGCEECAQFVEEMQQVRSIAASLKEEAIPVGVQLRLRARLKEMIEREPL